MAEITYQDVVNLLTRKAWELARETNRFRVYAPPSSLGFDESYKLYVPILFGAPDYKEYLSHTVEVIKDIYQEEDPQQLFPTVDYIEDLKRRAIYMRLKPLEVRFDHTLPFSEVGSFINNLNKSFTSYLQITFEKRFSDLLQNDFIRIKRAKEHLRQRCSLRLIDLQYQSFGFGVSIDTLHSTDIDTQEIKDWRRELLSNYDDDVLLADYSKEETLDRIKDMFKPKERKDIYDPIFKAINTDSYEVLVTNNIYQTQKKVRRIPKATELDIVPDFDFDRLTERSVKFVNAVVAINEQTGKPILPSKQKLKEWANLFSDSIENFPPIREIVDTSRARKLTFPNSINVALDYNQHTGIVSFTAVELPIH